MGAVLQAPRRPAWVPRTDKAPNTSKSRRWTAYHYCAAAIGGVPACGAHAKGG